MESFSRGYSRPVIKEKSQRPTKDQSLTPKELGRLCQKAFRLGPDRPRLPRPLHPPRGALQRSYSPSPRRRSHLELSRSKRRRSQKDDNAGGPRIYLPLPAPRLTRGFMRIRHFGFLANRSKKQALGRCRKLLDLDPVLPPSPFSQPKTCCLKSSASIFLAARAAMRER